MTTLDDNVSPGDISLNDKAQYVRKATQTRPHCCHWPGCPKQVKPGMWGCREHWFKLPMKLRKRIWEAYRPGQEETGRVSDEYFLAAAEAEVFAEQYNADNQ